MDRNTPHRDGELFSVPVAAGKTVYAGNILCASVTGFGVPGAAIAGLTTLGVAWEQADNSLGTDGDVSVLCRRAKAFNFANFGADPVSQASVGKPCYIADSQTVAATSDGDNRPVAGIVLFIDADGVWVLI